MARLDIRSLQSLKQLKQRQGESDREAFSAYHYLACVHGLANTLELKHQLVYHYPEMSAQIFYHFDDREIAGILVTDYSAHQDGKLRQLALSVRDVLHARSSTSDKLEKVLGIKISKDQVKNIFARLQLDTAGEYSVTIPTFRQDLKIEEDLIEEVGRIYGYNNFPKTLPESAVPTAKVSYAKNYDFEYEVKQILKGAGYNEIYSYSLISESQLIKLGIDPGEALRIDNPISRDYEYLRPQLLGNLIESLKQNLPNFSEIKLFELGKQYRGESLDKFSEDYSLTGIFK